MCPQETHCPPSAGRWILYHRNSVWPMVFGYQRKCSQEVSQIFAQYVEGKIFSGVLARRMTTFLISNHYINTSVQKAGIPGFPGCLEHSQMIWNSILSAKRDQTELHVIWLDLANAYSSVPHHLILMALEFFKFPSKVGEIIMIYFNSALMKFIVKSSATKWQALEIGIMMGCGISPLLFVLAMELILRGAANTSKGVMKNDFSSFQSFCGRHHHSRPIPNRCRWFTTKVL